MPLLDRGGMRIERWRRVGADEAVPSIEDVILPLDRLAQEGEAVLASGRRLGVALANDADLDALAPWLDRLGLIAVGFPSFADGRGFSIARQLRLRGFEGELRAVGPLIADQFAFALFCGFDVVEIDDARAARQPLTHWLEAVDAFSAGYQPGYGGPQSILEARRAAQKARPSHRGAAR
jgi:uncharacterized protein (DUF934 family)